LHQFARNPRKRRRGHRLVHAELQRELAKQGQPLNHKRIYRLWREEGLCVPAHRRKKKVRSGKPGSDLVAEEPDAVWCLDFLEQKSLYHQKLRILSVSDEFTREVLAIEVGTRFVSARVVATLNRLVEQRGTPGALRMDNGPEFIALELRGMCYRQGIDPAHMAPGKPWQNGYAESFHSRLRDEFMDGEAFLGGKDAQVRLEGWRRYFNEERLHSSLGYRTPCELAALWATWKEESDRAFAGSAPGSAEAEPAAPAAEENQPVAGTEEAAGT